MRGFTNMMLDKCMQMLDLQPPTLKNGLAIAIYKIFPLCCEKGVLVDGSRLLDLYWKRHITLSIIPITQEPSPRILPPTPISM